VELENRQGKGLCLGLIPPLRLEDVAEKNKILRLFFRVKPDPDFPMRFYRETAGDDENLSLGLEQAVGLPDDVVGIALELPFGNGLSAPPG